MIVYIYNIGVDLYNGFNGLRHRINWTYFTVLDGLAHPLYSVAYFLANVMLITITSPVGIFNVSDVKPELKATENIFFETLPNVNYISNESINDLGLEILKTTKEYPESC